MTNPAEPRILAVIPARFASKRLPGKVLLDLGGKPVLQHVFERVVASRCARRTLVATDDERIAAAVRAFGSEAVMTSPSCETGTDRVAEAARRCAQREAPDTAADAELVLNVQGDEPFIDGAALRDLVAAFADPAVEMATLARAARPDERDNPNVVKVVCDARGDALYFSRSAIPFARNGGPAPLRAHVGVYAYRARTLARLATLAPTPLERAEKLEQLRALEHGVKIRLVDSAYDGFGIDTAQDLERARRMLAPFGP